MVSVPLLLSHHQRELRVKSEILMSTNHHKYHVSQLVT